MTTKYTPGPWRTEHDDSAIVADCALGRTVARVYWTRTQQGDDPEARANARLIAAAPEMRAALSLALAWANQRGNIPVPAWVRDARALLARVDGGDTQ